MKIRGKFANKLLIASMVVGLSFSLTGNQILAQNEQRQLTIPNREQLRQQIQSQVETKKQEIQAEAAQVRLRMASEAAELKLRAAEQREIIRQRLVDAEVEVCQQRSEAITRHVERLNQASTTILDKMTSIANKVVEFKEAQSVEVDNYQELLASLEAKRLVVVEAIEQAESDGLEFDCLSDGPKAQLSEFVTSTDMVRSALKDYRAEIHTLIAAVRAGQQGGQ